MMTLDTPVTTLVNFGKTLAPAFKRLEIATVRDLLLHFPHRYQDFRQRLPIVRVPLGSQVTVVGTLTHLATRRSWKRHTVLTEAVIEDQSGSLRLLWFHQPYIARMYRIGQELAVSGVLRENRYGVAMVAPLVERFDPKEFEASSGFLSVYPLTRGITNRQLRLFVRRARPAIPQMQEWLPPEVVHGVGLLPIATAIARTHFPRSLEDAQSGERRFAFEQLFVLQCEAQLLRARSNKERAQRIAIDEAFMRILVAALPFPLTDDQRKAVWQMLLDMAGGDRGTEQHVETVRPMNRLLNGDVGTGKTVVATLSLLAVAHQGSQGMFLVPTEILARQHFERIKALAKEARVAIGLLTRSQQEFYSSTGERQNVNARAMRKRMFEEHALVIIGTHALLSKTVVLPRLALVVVDEQHRFGVEQRRQALLRAQPSDVVPHYCSMTATPIPRTLALAFFGDFDLSLLTTFPRSRRRVRTTLLGPDGHDQALRRLERALERHEPFFVVCPRIQEGEGSPRRAALTEHQRLSKELPTARLGLLYGTLNAAEKERVIQDFRDRRLDGIVTTSVIEVGVDIPEASLMVVEGANYFGLSQLHQLRGRVGRAGQEAAMVVVSDDEEPETLIRLKTFAALDDGWELAQRDLLERGPGVFFGQHQSGGERASIAALADRELLEKAHEAARSLLRSDPELQQHPLVRERVLEKVRGAKNERSPS